MIKKLIKINENLNNRLGVIRSFAILSFIVMVIISLYLTIAISAIDKEHTIQQLATSTRMQSETIISPNLNNVDFNKPIGGKRLKNFNHIIKTYFITKKNNIKRIKIWNKNGMILYSDNNKLIGKKFQVNKDLRNCFKGKFFATIVDMDESENAYDHLNDDQMVEIFVPLYFNNSRSPEVVYEVYQGTASINRQLINDRNRIFFLVSLGLLFLYLTLTWSFRDAYIKINKQANKLKELNIELEHSIKNMEDNYLDTIKALTLAVDTKDHYTAGHSIRVTDVSVALAKELNLSEFQVEKIEKAALFHDIGKIGVPQEILNKPARLTDSEYEEVKKHPVLGAKIIQPVMYLKPIVNIVKHHHEHFDGKGYPDGLKHKEISIESRIIAVADTYDAIITSRPHRAARNSKDALIEIARCSGTQFDPDVVKALIRGIKKGNIVNSTNNRMTGNIYIISKSKGKKPA